MTFLAIFSAIFLFLFQMPTKAQLFNGSDLKPAQIQDLVAQVQPGTVLFLGENHGVTTHQEQHMQILNKLREQPLKISVGLEFLNFVDQPSIDLYRQGELSEADFLKAVDWKGFGFEFYRDQLNFPRLDLGEKSIGLNISRAVTSKISKNGLNSLSPEERNLIPADFQLGRDTYRERFRQAAGAHCRNFENCFTAQSVWDEVMAQQVAQFFKSHPDHVLVVVVGDFHVHFGGGLPDRVKQRAPDVKQVVLSQIWAEDLSEEDLQTMIQPTAEEGPRADFIWVSRP